MINPEVLEEARRQIGFLFRSLRLQKNLGTKTVAEMTGMSETQVLDIELARRNFTIENFLKYTYALDVYFFLSEKEGNHLNTEHMLSKAKPDEAAL